MADELATPEVVETPDSAPVDSAEEAQPEVDTPVSEDDENTDDSPRGDLREALRQERQKRQDLEARLNSDPNFVYQLAQRHGLTEAEAAEQMQQQVSQAQPGLTDAQVDARVEFNMNRAKALEKYPELSKNDEDQISISALASGKYGGNLLKAADKYYSRIAKVKTEAKSEGISAAKAEVTAKERAQTAPVNVNTDSDTTYMEDLLKRRRSPDSRVNSKAMEEWLIYKAKNKK